MQVHWRALGILLILLIVVGSAWAGPPTEQLRRRIDEVIRVLDDPALKDKPAERRGRIRQLAEDIFDYPDTARRALGPHWNERTPQERQEFVKLFADLLDRAYISRIDQYQGEKVKWIGETTDGNEAVVKTAIVTKSGRDVPVDYRMHQRDGAWRVYDVVIEGVSLVANYRTQFNKIVQTESYDALVQKLRARGTAPAATSGPR